MVIVDVKPKELGIPTEAYYAVEEILEGKQQQWTFKHVPSEIGAMEAEEVGVEHLLRDVKDMTISTLANQVTQKLGALKGLAARLSEVDAYLQNVLSGRMPVNHRIIYELQDVFNLLPNLNVEELVKAFAVKTNDMMLAVYLSSIIRSVVALHNLINNKIHNKASHAPDTSATSRLDLWRLHLCTRRPFPHAEPSASRVAGEGGCCGSGEGEREGEREGSRAGEGQEGR